MPVSIFYSWLRDLPNNTNRGFIRDCIDRAAKKLGEDMEVEEAARYIEIQEGIKGVPGNPDVANTIFERIDNCDIFVADISIIGVTNAGTERERRTPNPNVMIEYGRAAISVRDHRIIPVFNSAHGNWEADRPFDMRHKGPPITYELSPDADPAEREAARDKLTKALERAIREILEQEGRKESPAPIEPPAFETFVAERQHYFTLLPKERPYSRFVGYWIAMKPERPNIQLPRPFEHPELFQRLTALPLNWTNGGHTDDLWLHTIDRIDEQPQPIDPKPIKNGGEQTWQRKLDPRNGRPAEDLCRLTIRQNGSLALSTRTTLQSPFPALSLHWLLVDVASCLIIAERIRRLTNSQRDVYWLAAEVRYDITTRAPGPHSYNTTPVPDGEWRLGLLQDDPDKSYTFSALVPSDPLEVDPIKFGALDGGGETLVEAMNAVLIAAGKRPIDDIIFKLPAP